MIKPKRCEKGTEIDTMTSTGARGGQKYWHPPRAKLGLRGCLDNTRLGALNGGFLRAHRCPTPKSPTINFMLQGPYLDLGLGLLLEQLARNKTQRCLS